MDAATAGFSPSPVSLGSLHVPDKAPAPKTLSPDLVGSQDKGYICNSGLLKNNCISSYLIQCFCLLIHMMSIFIFKAIKHFKLEKSYINESMDENKLIQFLIYLKCEYNTTRFAVTRLDIKKKNK